MHRVLFLKKEDPEFQKLVADLENNAKLLAELGSLPASKRRARYVCHIALADPQGRLRAESEGSCRGCTESLVGCSATTTDLKGDTPASSNVTVSSRPDPYS